MRIVSGALVFLVGVALTLVGLVEAYGAAGLAPNLRLVFAWSLLAILGLYLVGWGVVRFVTAPEAPRAVNRPTDRAGRLDTRPSPDAHTRRGRPTWSRDAGQQR